MLTITVAEASAKAIKTGYFSKRGPTRNSKYNLRYWVLTDTSLYYFSSASVRFFLTQSLAPAHAPCLKSPRSIAHG